MRIRSGCKKGCELTPDQRDGLALEVHRRTNPEPYMGPAFRPTCPVCLKPTGHQGIVYSTKE